MVYRKPHVRCTENNCITYSAYIRIHKKWTKAGEYNYSCGTFTPAKSLLTYREAQRITIADELKQKLDHLEKLGFRFKV